MEDSAKEYVIQSFDKEIQYLLKTSLKEPSKVDLERVSNIIVDQSLRDPNFSKEAGRICHTIVQAEAKEASASASVSASASASVFRRHLLNRLQREFMVREETRNRSVQEWVHFVTFLCQIFDCLKVNDVPMVALVHPVYDCLFRLAQSDSLQNEEEVDCLVLQLHLIGRELEAVSMQRMDDLFHRLRDGFLLHNGLGSVVRLFLLEILEFRAGGWSLSDSARQYYYSEGAD